MQHLGLAALLLLIPLALVISIYWPLKRGLSVSENIASNRTSQRIFSIGFTPITILYYVFLAYWLGPHYVVASVYYFVLVAAFVAQLVLIWVPAKGSRPLMVHTTASYIVAIAMLFVVGLMLFTSEVRIGTLLAVFCWLFLVIGIVMTLTYLLVPKARKDYALYELVYFLTFWAVIVIATYL